MTQEAKNLYKLRLRHAKFISTLIIWQPFARAVILNGSLTGGRTKVGSDIDLLIIAKTGRIFTTRFMANLAVWLTGLKRGSRADSPHAGKICLNYFLTEGFLIVPHHRSEEMNRYCAENYSASVLLAGDWALFDKFLAMNALWMEKHIKKRVSPRKDTVQTRLLSSRGGRGFDGQRGNLSQQYSNITIKQGLENLLSGRFGQSVENYLKRIQLNRIYRDPRTKAFPDLIHADDREMRFHPPKTTKKDSEYI